MFAAFGLTTSAAYYSGLPCIVQSSMTRPLWWDQSNLKQQYVLQSIGSSFVHTRRGKPSLSIDDVHRCVDEMYHDDTSRDIEHKIDTVQVMDIE